jgi:enoyl-CoA hydratase
MSDARTMTQVKLDVEDQIATVTVERPKVLNALNRRTLDELEQVFTEIGERDEIAGVILTGAGDKAFVAGADIAELAELSTVSGRATARRGQSVLSKIERLGKPTIAAINGYALGGGCELALACTLRVAAAHARIGLPEVTLGIIPGYGGTQRLARLVGQGRAYELILTGEPITAESALAIGLVNRVVPAGELLPTAREILSTIAKRGPLAVGAALDVVRLGLDASLDGGLDLEAAYFGVLCGTEDMREGMQAFLEKRAARFRGR